MNYLNVQREQSNLKEAINKRLRENPVVFSYKEVMNSYSHQAADAYLRLFFDDRADFESTTDDESLC